MAGEFMPDDYTPPVRSSGGGSSGELAHAAAMCRERPGVWVKIHDPREMAKPPSAWASEVNLDGKPFLTERRQDGERWEASYEEHPSTDGKRYFTKLLRLVSASTSTALDAPDAA